MILCDAPGCVRGIIHSEWGTPCWLCEGQGAITLAELCRRIEECESTMVRLIRNKRMRAKTTARICSKISELIA